MKINVYSIFDAKAGAYLHPWFAQNHNLAFRNMLKACMNASSPFVDFPADFHLFCIGTFDEQNGVIDRLEVHENLGNMFQFQPETPPLTASNA